MGYLNEGILSGITGKVGTVVGGTWRGVDYIRSKGRVRRNRTSTENQQMQQSKFTMVASFIATMVKLVELGFKEFAVKKTGRNCAVSYALTNAVTGQHPDWQLDYSRVRVSMGSQVPGADHPSSNSPAAGTLGFTWTDNSGTGKATEDDRAIVAAYCPEKRRTIYKVTDAKRSDEAATLQVPAFSGLVVHCWLSFISVDKTRVSDSAYTGQLNVL
jgi:hypothetical protein